MEAETGKVYRTTYLDRLGRPVIIMVVGKQVSAASSELPVMMEYLELSCSFQRQFTFRCFPSDNLVRMGRNPECFLILFKFGLEL